MKILLLGGTGAMGIHLVDLLLKEGNHVYVTTRKEIKSTEYLHYIRGNARDPQFLKKVLAEDWDVIVDFMIYTTKVFESVHKLLLAATKQYIFLSSARVFSESFKAITEESSRLLDVCEDEEYLETEEYALIKARQENILQKSEMNNWTIVRPYITFSENRFQLGVLEKEEWLYRALRGRTIIFSKGISERITTLTYGYDVSYCIKRIINNKNALGESFNITGSNSIKWEEVLYIYLNVLEKHLGYRPKYILQDTEGFLSWKKAEYQVKYDRFYNREFNNTKINDFMEGSIFSEINVNLEKSLRVFLQKETYKYIKWDQEALKDKLVGERTNLSEIPGNRQKIIYTLYRNVGVKTITKWKNIIRMKKMRKLLLRF